MTIKFKPLHNLVAIEPIEVKDTTKSGIILPGNSKIKPTKGVVVAVGPGIYSEKGELIPVGITVGTTVMFNETDQLFQLDDETEVIIISANNIIGVLS